MQEKRHSEYLSYQGSKQCLPMGWVTDQSVPDLTCKLRSFNDLGILFLYTNKTK